MAEKRGGCFRTGCGVLAAGVVLFMVYAVISSLNSNTEDTNTAQPSSTAAPTVTPRPTEIEETEPQPEGEGPVQPDPEESAEPTTEEEQSSDLAGVVADAPDPEEIVSRTYEWEYGGTSWTWEMTIPKATYEYFQGIPRPPTMNYSVYVTHPSDDLYVDGIVREIREAAEEKGYSEYQTVEFAIAFVQSMPYTVDSVTTPFDEYPRYPAETLVDGGGDCEDTAILLASLLDSMGFGVVLIELPDHMAVGVKGGETTQGIYWEYDGDKYFYIETTGSGWQIGELPDEYAGVRASILPMQPVPIVTHDWSLEAQGFIAVLEVRVDNLGTATASDVYVFAGWDAGDGKVWGAEQSNLFSLGPGRYRTVTLGLLLPPSGEHTRLLVRIVMGEYTVDESYSAWFDY